MYRSRKLHFALGMVIASLLVAMIAHVGILKIARPWMPGTPEHTSRLRGDQFTTLESYMNGIAPHYEPDFDFTQWEADRSGRRKRLAVSTLPPGKLPLPETVVTKEALADFIYDELVQFQRNLMIQGVEIPDLKLRLQEVFELLAIGSLADLHRIGPVDVLALEAHHRFGGTERAETIALLYTIHAVCSYSTDLGYHAKSPYDVVFFHVGARYR